MFLLIVLFFALEITKQNRPLQLAGLKIELSKSYQGFLSKSPSPNRFS